MSRKIVRILSAAVTSLSDPSCSRSRLRLPTRGAQAGGVQEFHLAEVRDDVPGAVAEQLDDALAQLRGGVHVDLAADPQDGAVGAGGDGF